MTKNNLKFDQSNFVYEFVLLDLLGNHWKLAFKSYKAFNKENIFRKNKFCPLRSFPDQRNIQIQIFSLFEDGKYDNYYS